MNTIKTAFICLLNLIVLTTFSQEYPYEWAKSIGTSGSKVTTDIASNVYVFGGYTGTMDFDPGPNTANLTATGFTDLFIQKMNSDGQHIWVKAINGTQSESASAIAVDANENVISTGWFSGTTDFDPGTGVLNYTPAGGFDIYLQSLDSNGDLNWAHRFGGLGNEGARTVIVDGAGNIYTSGFFGGTVDFDPGPGVVNLTSAGSWDTYILKFDQAGNLLWAKSTGGTGVDGGSELAFDPNGNIVLTGVFTGFVDFDLVLPGTSLFGVGGTDVYIHKFDPNGNFIWVRGIGGPQSDDGDAIAIDPSGNVIIAGAFESTTDFDPGMGVVNLTSIGPQSNGYILILDSNGDFQWVGQMASSDYSRCQSVTTDSDGNIYTMGIFFGSVSAGTTGVNPPLTGNGDFDMFIQKVDFNWAFDWAYHFGGSGSDQSTSIRTDSNDNLYTTGFFSPPLDFDPGPGIQNISTALMYQEGFILKLSGCISSYTLFDPDHTYQSGIAMHKSAELSINGTNTIETGASVIYDAGDCILLSSGFDAQLGCDFEAIIGGCSK